MLTRDYDEAVWHDPVPTDGSALSDAWLALTVRDRDLLGLVVWETLTTDQIAAVLGCSRSVAKVRIHRARRRFARELEQRDIEAETGEAQPTCTGWAGRSPPRYGGDVMAKHDDSIDRVLSRTSSGSTTTPSPPYRTLRPHRPCTRRSLP